MVTRHVSPAAYLKGCATTFCTIDTLRDTIAHFDPQATRSSTAAYEEQTGLGTVKI